MNDNLVEIGALVKRAKPGSLAAGIPAAGLPLGDSLPPAESCGLSVPIVGRAKNAILAPMRYWTECREFFGEFRRHYFTTGSVLPSSRSLARALVSQVRRRQGPARILEIGPGTGAVTAEILQELRPEDRLDIVEINEHFIRVLQRRFEQEPLFQRRRDQVTLIHAPLQEVPGKRVYDYMISGLPLNNFPLSLVREIFHSYHRLLKPGGVLSYFEYLWLRTLKALIVDRRRLHVLSRYLQRQIHAGQFREQWVFLNVPPAVARHFCFDPE